MRGLTNPPTGNVCCIPLQSSIIKLPVAGGLVKLICPLVVYSPLASHPVVFTVMPVMEQVTVQGSSAVKLVVNVQVGVAENTAVTLQAAPFDGKPVRLYACGLVNGALNTWLFPLQSVTVNVPDAGALVKVITPSSGYAFVAGTQAPFIAVNPVIEQVHATGAA